MITCNRPMWSKFAWLIVLFSALMVLVASCTEARSYGNKTTSSLKPARIEPTDHSDLFKEPFADGPSVTRACLTCHMVSAEEMLNSTHWTWINDEAVLPGDTEPSGIGKLNLLNNFCISITGNWQRCSSCHAGYGWEDNSFDFTNPENIDCLICHDQTGGYVKDPDGAGRIMEGVDLLASAKSVGRPTRRNCGACHFSGGGGDAVKHGDLDNTMQFPSPRIDVHMGEHELECVDCHRTENHRIGGRLPTLNKREEMMIGCSDCHGSSPHEDERLNSHFERVSCQACHIPYFAVETPTKMSWDWATAGEDTEPEESYFDQSGTHEYAKIKGSFIFNKHVTPSYMWFNGQVNRQLPGQVIDPDSQPVKMVWPVSTKTDSDAKLWPFKIHRGRQIYDTVNNYLLRPKTAGDGGYWETFDWTSSLEAGAELGGLPFSGEYSFIETKMSWPITHMVQASERALQCTDCHGEGAVRIDWKELGYKTDPAFHQEEASSESDHGLTGEGTTGDE